MATIEVVAVGDRERSGKKDIEPGTTVAALITGFGFTPEKMKQDSVSIDGEIVKDLNQVVPEGARGVLIAKNAENGKY